MSMSVEDRGFSALCAMGRPKGAEATWSLGVVGVGAAAVVGMVYLKGRSNARAEVETGKMVTQPKRDKRGRVIIDPQTGQPVMENVFVKKKFRGKKLAVNGQGQVVEETAGIVVSDLDTECQICGDKMTDYTAHLKAKHGVEVSEPEEKVRRKPRKKELEKLLSEMTPLEQQRVTSVVIRSQILVKDPGGTSLEAGQRISPEDLARLNEKAIEDGKAPAMGVEVEGIAMVMPILEEASTESKYKSLESEIYEEAVRATEEAASRTRMGREQPLRPSREPTFAEERFLGGRRVMPRERALYDVPTTRSQIGVAYKDEKLTDDELDTPIDLTAPGVDESVQKLIGYRLKIAPPGADIADLEEQVADNLFQDPVDLEVPFDLAEQAIEGGRMPTLRELGIKTKKVRIPIYNERPKKPEEPPQVVIARLRNLMPQVGGDEKRAKMVRAAELFEELRLEEEAKKKRELLDEYWPDKTQEPKASAPGWVVKKYLEYLARQEDTADRLRERALGRNAGRFYTWEKDAGALLALFGQEGETIASKDAAGDFIYGAVLEGPFKKKIPVKFENLTPEADRKLGQILLGFRRQRLRPEEAAILFDPNLDERARKKALANLRKQPVPDEVRKQQKAIADGLMEKLLANPESYRTVSPEREALYREPFVRKTGARATRIGAEPPKVGRKEIKPYRGG